MQAGHSVLPLQQATDCRNPFGTICIGKRSAGSAAPGRSLVAVTSIMTRKPCAGQACLCMKQCKEGAPTCPESCAPPSNTRGACLHIARAGWGSATGLGSGIPSGQLCSAGRHPPAVVKNAPPAFPHTVNMSRDSVVWPRSEPRPPRVPPRLPGTSHPPDQGPSVH